MWKTVKDSVKETRIGTAKGGRSERRTRKRKKIDRVTEERVKKKDHHETKDKEDNGSKEVDKRVEDW